MAHNFPVASKLEVRAVIKFLMLEKITPIEIHRRITAVYGDVLSVVAVRKWVRRFKDGDLSLEDHARPGQAHVVVKPENVAAVDVLIQKDRRITVSTLSHETGLSIGSIHTIVHDHLGYRKICAQWVPKLLSEEQRDNRAGMSLMHLERYVKEGEGFLDMIVAGDETWCPHFQPETKKRSMQWKHANSPPPKKFMGTVRSSKIMVTVFFDCKGLLLLDFLPKGTTINAKQYCSTLDKLRKAIKNKRPGMLTRGVTLLHDNARPHTAVATTSHLQHFKWEILQHPPYSPDLSPCDYHVFGPFKKALKGHRFLSDDDLKQSVTRWFKCQPQHFYDKGIRALVNRWNQCLDAHGDYF
jgi:histone-lysine N-methyltransferase SETMAR